MPNIRDLTALVKELAPVVKAHVEAAFRPLAVRLKDVEDRQPEKGDTGPAGKDAAPVDIEALVDEAVAKLLTSERLKTLTALAAVEAVAEHFQANPVQHGKDGRDGEDGERGLQGERGPKGDAGDDGRAGLDVKDMLRSHEGHLIAVMSDGTTRDLGQFVGADGRDGIDGLSMVDVAREYDSATHEVIERWSVGGVAKELRYAAGGIRPGGFWRENTKTAALQAVTHDGALWIAKRDTTVKPSIEAKEDWQLAARKGRDGKDGRNGIDKTAPVKLEGTK